MVRVPFYKQNGGHLAKDPPDYMGRLAKECYRKIVPYLESTAKVERIDTHLIEQYCTTYEIYRLAYADIKENGIQTAIYKTVQNHMGEPIGQDLIGFKKNAAVNTLKESSTLLNQLGIQLGLSPKARQDLMAIAVKQENDKSIAEMMKDVLKG